MLVGVGVALRVALMGSTPPFVGFPDAAWYMIAAGQGVFSLAAEADTSPWPAGYPEFLRILRVFGDTLTFAIFVQHVLGVATGLLLFATVRRVVSAWWALLPAAVVLLAGPQLFLEHAPMAEALFAFLLAVCVYCATRAYDSPRWYWAASAGLVVACAGCVRLQGLTLAPILLIWLLVGIRLPARARLIAVAAATAAFALVIGAYLAEMKHETGFGGPALTRSGSFGVPEISDGPAGHVDRLAPDLARFWSSDANTDNGGLGYEGFITGLVTPQSTVQIEAAARWYPTLARDSDDASLSVFDGYERHTRVEGLVFLLLLLLAVGGLVPARGRQLAVGLFVTAVAIVSLMTPLLFAQFDARYVVPAYGSLAAAGAIGAATLWERFMPWMRRLRRPAQVPAVR